MKTFKMLLHVSIIRSSSLFLAKVTVAQQANLSNTYKNTRLKLLNCNFSKQQSVIPEDDRMIETCRSVLSVLM